MTNIRSSRKYELGSALEAISPVLYIIFDVKSDSNSNGFGLLMLSRFVHSCVYTFCQLQYESACYRIKVGDSIRSVSSFSRCFNYGKTFKHSNTFLKLSWLLGTFILRSMFSSNDYLHCVILNFSHLSVFSAVHSYPPTGHRSGLRPQDTVVSQLEA